MLIRSEKHFPFNKKKLLTSALCNLMCYDNEHHAWEKYFPLLSYFSEMFWDRPPQYYLFCTPSWLWCLAESFSRTFHFVKWLSIWTARVWKRKQEKIQTKHYFSLTWLDLASYLCKTRQNIFFLNFTILTWTEVGTL